MGDGGRGASTYFELRISNLRAGETGSGEVEPESRRQKAEGSRKAEGQKAEGRGQRAGRKSGPTPAFGICEICVICG